MKKLIALAILIAAVAVFSACGKTGENVNETTMSPEITNQNGEKVKLNLDIFSDLGLNYTRLNKKYGELVEFGSAVEGGMYCKFERGFGKYCWADWDLEGDAITQNETGYFFRQPKAEAGCIKIYLSEINDLFLGATLPISFFEIEKILKETDGVTDIEMNPDYSNPDVFPERELYWITFRYSGAEVSLIAQEEDILDVGLKMSIYSQSN